MSSDKEKTKKDKLSFSVGDTVVVKQENKHIVVFVHKKTDRYCSGSVIKHAPYDEVLLEFLREQVICNLGTKPVPGSLYGQHVEPYFRSAVSDMGQVHFFYSASGNEKNKIIERLNKIYAKMKSKGLTGFLPVVVEMRPPKGTFDGHYKPGRKDNLDTLCVRPREELNFYHITYHELAHGLWIHLLTNKMKAKWIKLYHKQVKIRKLTVKDSKGLLKGLLKDKLTIKEYMSSLEEENQIFLKEIVKYVKAAHRLSQKDLDTMILAEEDISEFWPTTDVEISDIISDVSEYGLKSVEEYFCDSFGFYMSKEKLPERAKQLLEKCLETIAGKKKASHEEVES